MAERYWNTAAAAHRPHLWLAARDGTRLPEPVNPVDEPEVPLEIEFVGLSEEEQLRALAAFPGGKRFTLKSVKH
jgi:hypothetical protein